MNTRRLTIALLLGLLAFVHPAAASASATDAHTTISPDRVSVMQDTNIIVEVHTKDHHPELGETEEDTTLSVKLTVPENTLVAKSDLALTKVISDGGTLAKRFTLHVPPTLGPEPVFVLVQVWEGQPTGEPFYTETVQVRIDTATRTFIPLIRT